MNEYGFGGQSEIDPRKQKIANQTDLPDRATGAG